MVLEDFEKSTLTQITIIFIVITISICMLFVNMNGSNRKSVRKNEGSGYKNDNIQGSNLGLPQNVGKKASLSTFVQWATIKFTP